MNNRQQKFAQYRKEIKENNEKIIYFQNESKKLKEKIKKAENSKLISGHESANLELKKHYSLFLKNTNATLEEIKVFNQDINNEKIDWVINEIEKINYNELHNTPDKEKDYFLQHGIYEFEGSRLLMQETENYERLKKEFEIYKTNLPKDINKLESRINNGLVKNFEKLDKEPINFITDLTSKNKVKEHKKWKYYLFFIILFILIAAVIITGLLWGLGI